MNLYYTDFWEMCSLTVGRHCLCSVIGGQHRWDRHSYLILWYAGPSPDRQNWRGSPGSGRSPGRTRGHPKLLPARWESSTRPANKMDCWRRQWDWVRQPQGCLSKSVGLHLWVILIKKTVYETGNENSGIVFPVEGLLLHVNSHCIWQ